MNRLKLAVLYHQRSLTDEERSAAMEGIRKFERFGVLCGQVDVGSGSISGIKRGRLLRNSILASDFKFHEFDIKHIPVAEALWGFFRRYDTMGIAVTEAFLCHSDGEKVSRSLGVSEFGVGGMVSVSRLRELCYRKILPDAVRLAVMHETGHILGMKGHCTSENCLMQENKNTLDFVQRFVEKDLKMCGNCEGIVAAGVSNLAELC
jgi:hypothetical protein